MTHRSKGHIVRILMVFWGVNTSEENAILKHDNMTLKSQIIREIIEVVVETE